MTHMLTNVDPFLEDSPHPFLFGPEGVERLNVVARLAAARSRSVLGCETLTVHELTGGSQDEPGSCAISRILNA